MPCLVCARAHLQAAFPWAIYSYVLNYTWWLRVLAIQHVDLNPDTSIHVTSCAPKNYGAWRQDGPWGLQRVTEGTRWPPLCITGTHKSVHTTQTPHSHTFKIKQNTWLVWVPPPETNKKTAWTALAVTLQQPNMVTSKCFKILNLENRESRK